MNAVLGIYLKALFGAFADNLVDPRWTISLRRLGPTGQIYAKRKARIAKMQVNRLIFFVVGIGQEN